MELLPHKRTCLLNVTLYWTQLAKWKRLMSFEESWSRGGSHYLQFFPRRSTRHQRFWSVSCIGPPWLQHHGGYMDVSAANHALTTKPYAPGLNPVIVSYPSVPISNLSRPVQCSVDVLHVWSTSLTAVQLSCPKYKTVQSQDWI